MGRRLFDPRRKETRHVSHIPHLRGTACSSSNPAVSQSLRAMARGEKKTNNKKTHSMSPTESLALAPNDDGVNNLGGGSSLLEKLAPFALVSTCKAVITARPSGELLSSTVDTRCRTITKAIKCARGALAARDARC